MLQTTTKVREHDNFYWNKFNQILEIKSIGWEATVFNNEKKMYTLNNFDKITSQSPRNKYFY